jgi:putative transcriptional regulator
MGMKRYNIQDVHERTGLSRTTISALYNGRATRIDFTTIEKLCSLFSCGIEQLFLLEEQRTTRSNKLEDYSHE